MIFTEEQTLWVHLLLYVNAFLPSLFTSIRPYRHIYFLLLNMAEPKISGKYFAQEIFLQNYIIFVITSSSKTSNTPRTTHSYQKQTL